MTERNDLVYPAGCRPILEDLGTEELIRRLKTLAHTLQTMGQDDGHCQQYIPLAIHLADEQFLSHTSPDVQLLIACCIADVLRIYAPEAPYKDPDKVKSIFMFLISQLGGLKDPKDPAFKRYFYLLENLAYVKSFNMCFELEDCQDIFCKLFSLMFKIVNDEHSEKVKSFMLDVLNPLLTEADSVTNELLDIILVNIVEPNKTQRKNAYLLAKDLIVKCHTTLEPYIQNFFNCILLLGKDYKELMIGSKMFDIIYELNKICPEVLLSVLPQLEVKLKSAIEEERLGAVSLLARMFSEPESVLAKNHPGLWKAFVCRFNDINTSIRIKCVQYSMHFLLNHPHLRKDITEALKLRQHDTEENVRFEVIMAIVSTAKRDCEVVSTNEDLLEFVKERTLDKKFKIRKEAMSGLAMIYKKYMMEKDVPTVMKKAITWIKDKILHGYYMSMIEDKLQVERLLNNSLVPYTLPPEERMKKLYHLLGTIDDPAIRAFIELQKNQFSIKKSVGEWIELHKKPDSPERQTEIEHKIQILSTFLPDKVKAKEFLKKFSINLNRDSSLLAGMEVLTKPDITCKECAVTMGAILKKLGHPIMTNLYYNTVKNLLERASSVMVDHEALFILIKYVEDCLKGGNLIEEIGLNPHTAGDRGLKLLIILSYVFPSHFLHKDVIQLLLSLLDLDGDFICPLVLFILTILGKQKSLRDRGFEEEIDNLVPTLKRAVIEGTPKQAKQAVRCLYVNCAHDHEGIFSELLESIKEALDKRGDNYLTAIVAFGHIAFNLADKFQNEIKIIISRKIVKNLLVKPYEVSDKDNMTLNGSWCNEDLLPDETRFRIEGLKVMARWLLGLKDDKMSAMKTFRMISAFIQNKGDLLQSNKLSPAEMAWLRLTAGTSMLKICQQKGVGDQYTVEQFYLLSHLITDEVKDVRDRFMYKLHKGLNRKSLGKALPLDFMGFYSLIGVEEDKSLKNLFKKYFYADIAKRREYAKTITMGTCTQENTSHLPNILPDYTIVFAIGVLTHAPFFTDYEDRCQLKLARNCLWSVLEPLVKKNEFYCFGFYKDSIENIKVCQDALNPSDPKINNKMYALCDLALALVVTKTTNFVFKDFPAEPRTPRLFFKKHDDENFVNTKLYIPKEFQSPTDALARIWEAPAERQQNGSAAKKSKKNPEPDPMEDSPDMNSLSETSDLESEGNEESHDEEEEPKRKRGRRKKIQ